MTRVDQPSLIELLQQALGRYQAGDASTAKTLCDQVLARQPDNIDALHLMGMFELRLGRPDLSAEWSAKALKAAPASHFALNNRAAAYLQLGQAQQALADCDAALEIKPDFLDARQNRGTALLQLGQFPEALVAFDAVLKARPLSADALAGRSSTRRLLGDIDGAKRDVDAAIRIDPNHTEALFATAAILQDAGSFDEACQLYDRVLATDPRHVNAYVNRLRAVFMQGKHAEVVEVYNRVRHGLPKTVKMADNPYVLHSKMNICDWSGFDEAVDAMRRGITAGDAFDVTFNALSMIDDPETLRAAAKLFPSSKNRAEPIAPPRPVSGRPVRVAYVSADFREHPAARLMAEVIERHDRRACTPIAIALEQPDRSPECRRVRAAFDQVVQVEKETDADIAAMIRRLEIDVVVDLMGDTSYNRSGVFACRAAPVQVSFLGFPGPSGRPWLDYILANSVVIPPDAERFFTEKVCRLPDTYYPTYSEVASSEPPTREACGLPTDALVFAAFSNTWKITPQRFELWMELLKRTPRSVLWLLSSTRATESNLRREAKRRGVAPSRIVMAQRTTHAEHMARHVLADVMLDTSPYGAHTTACDSLFMGVPIVTMLGKTFPSRVAASILTAYQLPELIIDTPEAYLELAARLGSDAKFRDEIRKKVVANRKTAALFNTARYARHMDLAFREMTDRAARGLAPETFDVPLTL